MKISLKIDTSPFARFVDRVVANRAPIREATEAASGVYHEAMAQRFAAASAGDGTWEPLAEGTIKQHAAKGDAPPHALHITGDLEKSLARGHADHFVETSESGDVVTVVEGTQQEVARWQNSGTSTIPARPIYVPPETQTLDAMKEKIVAGIRESIHASQ